ncbi:reverse transcriptase domain-containing protein [Tanacetum coccineum]|uniref:Reverse transcriptase domain-containing protein n=1 Tax=Tanacetum coccineum TaxID=301880 RepID=A0ABQ4WK89_9ASTR
MDEDELVLIILGRPFLIIARAVIDVQERKLSLRVRNETVTFNIGKSMKSKAEPVKPLEWKALENRLKPLSVEPPKLELKELPKHLEYAFLQEDNQLPVVISSALSATKKVRLLEVLRNHKGSIAWSIVVPKKGGMTVVKNEKNELIPQRTITGWPDHLSRLENPDLRKLTKAEIRDLFLEEQLMTISDKSNEPWYADYTNYLASRILTFRSTRQEKQKFFNDLWHYFLDEPFLFKQCADQIIRRCVAGNEAAQILQQCHSGPSGGHHGIATTARKVEAQAFPASDARNVVNFLKRLFARFGIPKALIRDMGTHFCNYQMERAMKRYEVIHRFSTAYHPQTNGQVENTNRAIKRILEKTIGNNRKEWSHKLDDALSAFRIAFKTPLGTTRFRIIYGKAYHLPINELDKLRLDAYESSISYKERTKRWHDKRIQAPTKYEKGDKVLLFNSRLRLFPGKLKSRWYGPFAASKDMKNGAIKLYDEDGNEITVKK